jgi:hypothetical protein
VKMLITCRAIWNVLRTFKIFYDHLVHFVLIWYIFHVLVSCTKKNLATLDQIGRIIAKWSTVKVLRAVYLKKISSCPNFGTTFDIFLGKKYVLILTKNVLGNVLSERFVSRAHLVTVGGKCSH